MFKVQTASEFETSVTIYTNTHGVMSQKMVTLYSARTRISSFRRTPETLLIPAATQFRRLSNHKNLYVVPSKFLFPPSCYGSKEWTQFPFPVCPNLDVPQNCVPDMPTEWLATLRSRVHISVGYPQFLAEILAFLSLRNY